MTYHHGITAQEKVQGILPMRNADTSTIALLATSSDADNDMYPLNTPVLLPGIKQDNLSKAGSNGTLYKSLKHIRELTNPTVIVLRLSDPTDVDSLDALLKCQSLFGVTPKLMGAPEIDTPEITRKLISLANRRRAVVYASPRDDDGNLLTELSEITQYRDTYGARELCLIENDWASDQPIIATALALRAKINEENPAGFTKSISNVPISVVDGISTPRTWDLEDPDTEVGYLNADEVTSVIQSEGFRFWGNRTCSSDPRFAFETGVLTAHFLLDTIIAGCFPFIDKPLTPLLVKDIIESINAKMREYVAKKYIIGGSVWYNEDINNASDLSQGILYIDYDYTPVPTLENLHLTQRITDRYLVDFSKLIAQAN